MAESIKNESGFFFNVDLKKVTTISAIEKFKLSFVKKVVYVDKIENMTSVYKELNGKIFILDQYKNG